ncbi:MAG: 50S ribosomal protein L25 [Flavobacteriales bacterium]|nr:50S ribosomal protein L25 [Flavobacteriales bacterium]
MKKVSLSGSPRGNVGKKDAKRLRREGKVPCVVYGGSEQTFFHLDEVAVKKVVYTPDVFQYEISIEGKKPITAIIQDLQFHPVTDRVVHIDFLELIEGKEAKIEIPIKMVGLSPGVRGGGRLARQYRKITAKGLPEKFPDAIEVDISDMEIGDKKRVADISADGLKFLVPQTDVIVAVKTSRAAMAEASAIEEGEGAEGAEEGAAAPAEGGEAVAPAEG